ncbi:MAG: tetratricopeptide repeat protein [Phycisphaerae bacterium]|nr:tetratricopeptide repeat protein [Phycisphaerae bacterium]
MTTDATDLASFFDQVEFDAQTYTRFADAAHASFQARERFEMLLNEYREKVEAGQGDTLKLALGLLILGKFGEALERFGRSSAGKVRHYYAAEAALGLNRFEQTLQELQQAAQNGWDAFEIDLRVAAVQVRAGDLTAAEKLVAKHQSAGAQRADWYYARGLLCEARDERVAAAQEYEKTLELDPDHAQAMFRCARLYDLFGDDAQALELYDGLTRQPRAHINALLNAAVIYEDLGKYDQAIKCLNRVLKAYPNHKRARLFLKSVESCRQMIIVEGGEEPIDTRARLLATPLSEFELSVRARNCLKKMNIRTVGELIHLSEAELLAYKNFGETSLNEIKALLTKKGLRLGLQPEEVEVESAEAEAAQKLTLPPGQEALLAKSVSELELSVRSRRCLQRLNVRTLRDLLQYSEAELLATRNFGVTSLTEIKARLAENGLQLTPKSTT